MQLESTASQSLQVDEYPTSTNYLINTSKALKGSKLKTKDFIRLQLLKFKHTSPTKNNEAVVQKNCTLTQNVEYKKFMPFGTIEQHEIHAIIADQREQLSRETRGRIKLFNNPKINTLFTPPNFYIPANTIDVKSKPRTSHQSRELQQKQRSSKSVAEQLKNNTVSFDLKTKGAQLTFHTENLGSKMNKLLNYLLTNQGKLPEEKEIKQADQCKQSKANETEERIYCSGKNLPSRKINNPTFMRQMKKHRKFKMQEKPKQHLCRFKSEEIKQDCSAEISHRDRTAKLYNRGNNGFVNYSVQLRKRGTTLDVHNCMVKREQSQNDSVFQRSLN